MHAAAQKPYRGKGMEGPVARWYARTRQNDIEDFRQQAKAAAKHLRSGCAVLEIAPGPGFFAIELARLGDFRITGLDISRTMVEIARENARNSRVEIDFRQGNASAMPFPDESFDFSYCSAAFKNFSEPARALEEMHRTLRRGGEALIVDLRRDVSLEEIDSYLKQSGRGRADAWLTKWVFRWVLVKRAYAKDDFVRMAERSPFGTCRITADPIGYEVRLAKRVFGEGH